MAVNPFPGHGRAVKREWLYVTCEEEIEADVRHRLLGKLVTFCLYASKFANLGSVSTSKHHSRDRKDGVSFGEEVMMTP